MRQINFIKRKNIFWRSVLDWLKCLKFSPYSFLIWY